MKETHIRITTGLFHSEAIEDLRGRMGNTGVTDLLRFWCLAAEIDPSGCLTNTFVEDLKQDDPDMMNYLLRHDLLQKKEDGYQIAFGLVYFDEPKQD